MCSFLISIIFYKKSLAANSFLTLDQLGSLPIFIIVYELIISCIKELDKILSYEKIF